MPALDCLRFWSWYFLNALPFCSKTPASVPHMLRSVFFGVMPFPGLSHRGTTSSWFLVHLYHDISIMIIWRRAFLALNCHSPFFVKRSYILYTLHYFITRWMRFHWDTKLRPIPSVDALVSAYCPWSTGVFEGYIPQKSTFPGTFFFPILYERGRYEITKTNKKFSYWYFNFVPHTFVT